MDLTMPPVNHEAQEKTMTLKDYFKKDYEPGLCSMEYVTLVYMLFTTILIGIYWQKLPDPTGMIVTRLLMLAAIGALYGLYRWYPCRALHILRIVPPMLGLISWYPETYDFCSQLPYLDHVFAQIDQSLFGCQPSLEFSKIVTSTFWSEAFNMGYYAYFYMMAATIVFYQLCRYPQADRAGFIFLASFFIYYVIFEFLPVAGPQFYFLAIGTDTAESGVFPAVGYYFQTHTEMLTQEEKGLFSHLVQWAHDVGERPTAAFPSSHVGMSTVTMLLAWKAKNKWLFWLLMPLYLLLCAATVYIKAHYLIDSICGFITALIFVWLTSYIYDHYLSIPHLRARS